MSGLQAAREEESQFLINPDLVPQLEPGSSSSSLFFLPFGGPLSVE